MKRILVFICLALCMILFVCSCGGSNTDTSSTKDSTNASDTASDTSKDTNSDTPSDSDIITDDGKYRAFVCDSEGNPIKNVIVNFCEGTNCSFGVSDKTGYVVLPSGSYHVTGVSSGGAQGYVFPETLELYFEGDSRVITITLEKAE